MNKYFLWAVAIAALCSSCETEDEAFATQTPDNYREKQTIVQQAKSVETNDYQMYQSKKHTRRLKNNAYNNHGLKVYDNATYSYHGEGQFVFTKDFHPPHEINVIHNQ